MMKAMLLKAPYEFELIEIPKPEPKAGEVRVKVLSTGICGSEMEAYYGRHTGRKAPVITGHEVCGVVDCLGEGVENLTVGTRVVAIPQQACGQCEWCLSGQHNMCENRLMLGFTNWPGSFAEYFVIPAELLLPIADNVTPQVGALMEPLAVAVHAVRRLGIKPGDSVAVYGSGAIGLMTILVARAAGAENVVAMDLFDFNLDMARRLGATHVHNTRMGSSVPLLREITGGRGIGNAIMACGAPHLVDEAVGALAGQGNIVLFAMFAEKVPLDLQRFKSRELRMVGSITYTEEDFAQAVALAEKYNDDLAQLVTHRFPLEKMPEAFAMAAARSEDMVRVIFDVAEEETRIG